MKFSYTELKNLTSKDGDTFRVDNIEKAYKFCENFAKSHYENFPVGSILIPQSKRKYFYAIYAVARIGDDIADELHDIPKQERIEMLENIESLVRDRHFEIIPIGNPIFLALRDTLNALNIPERPILDLMTAFKMDVNFQQAETWEDLEHYCKFSANPVGELVLRIFDNYNEQTAIHSDQICTGLQLVNFWQDFSRDLPLERHYIPSEILKKFKISNNDLLNKNNINNLVNCLNYIFQKTEKYFLNGKNLINYLSSKRLKAEIAFTIEGGVFILDACKKMGTNLIEKRPKIRKVDFFKILLNVVLNYNRNDRRADNTI